MTLNTELVLGAVAVLLAVAAYFGKYRKGSIEEFDKENKILEVCEAVHKLLGPVALATPNKIDDTVDAMLQSAIALLKDKHSIEVLSDAEKESMKKFFLEAIGKK